jgi:hypothetical protein
MGAWIAALLFDAMESISGREDNDVPEQARRESCQGDGPFGN